MTRITLALVVATLPTSLWAHDWYSGLVNEAGQYCCGGNDCAEVADQYVTPMKNGYLVNVPDFFGKSVEAFVPSARARPAKQGGNYHMCVVAGDVRCFFFPAPTY